MLEISVNNTPKNLEQPSTVKEALTQWGYDTNGMLGVAVNQTFVPKTQWEETLIQDKDQIDILQPIVGG